jgi:hypothetical protein
MSRWPYQVFVRPSLNTATVPRLVPFSYSCFTYPWSFVNIHCANYPDEFGPMSSASTIRAYQQHRHT